MEPQEELLVVRFQVALQDLPLEPHTRPDQAELLAQDTNQEPVRLPTVRILEELHTAQLVALATQLDRILEVQAVVLLAMELEYQAE